MEPLKYCKLSDKVKAPVRATSGSAGFDIYCLKTITLNPKEKLCVNTGLCFAIPDGYYGHIVSRSSLVANYGISVLAGIIDSDYRGEIKIILLNSNTDIVTLPEESRIAQIIFKKYYTPELHCVDSLEITDRGEKGFGSTGL